MRVKYVNQSNVCLKLGEVYEVNGVHDEHTFTIGSNYGVGAKGKGYTLKDVQHRDFSYDAKLFTIVEDDKMYTDNVQKLIDWLDDYKATKMSESAKRAKLKIGDIRMYAGNYFVVTGAFADSGIYMQLAKIYKDYSINKWNVYYNSYDTVSNVMTWKTFDGDLRTLVTTDFDKQKKLDDTNKIINDLQKQLTDAKNKLQELSK